MKTKLHFVLSLSLFLTVFSGIAQQSYWQKTDNMDLNVNGNTTALNQKFYQTYQLDIDAFKAQLVNAPLRSASTTLSNSKVYLPNIEGELEQFMVVEAPVLSDELSQRYPNIKTYLGFSIKNAGTRVRFSLTPQGLQTLTTYPDAPMTFTVPLSKSDNASYIIYSRAARTESLKDFKCLTEDEFFPIETNGFVNRDANDQILRTFRIAISTTGEYTNFWDDGNAGNGDAQEDALGQVVSTLNRSNEVFEVDMAVTFTLVTGTEIIYPNAGNDPYTGNLNSNLQNALTANVGEANYDIGHLFTFDNNNGNAGCIGCVCVDGSKGSGFSAHEFLDNDGGPYMSDFFDIDYVPHEIGHQMGANHTFSTGNEGQGVNAEPGSGTTIMGYAGITSGNDVQDHSDPYFHYFSILQILNNLENRTCWVGSAITNSSPVADAGLDYTIPMGTAFVLKAAAADVDGGDVLTYTWEQIDDGTTTTSNFGPNKTSGAVWRSRPPGTSKERYMPIVERVISGQLTETNPAETADNSSWETVSNVGRALNFALVVRDRSEANGVGQTPQSDFDTMSVVVDGSAGPFVVTSQTTNESWNAGSLETVTWNVAGTDGGAVNTPTVNILLSIDGGFTYPFTMATEVPNDGSHSVTVPVTAGNTSTARLKVEGNTTIFYAINATNFTIQESEFVLNVADNSVDVCSPDDVVFNFIYNTFLGFTDETTFSASGLPLGATATFTPSTATENDTNVTATVSGIAGLTLGNYSFILEGTAGSISKTADLEFNVFDSNLVTLTLLTPVDGATDVEADEALFTWNADPNALSYEIDIATDAAFTSIVSGIIVSETNYTLTTLNALTSYFWRVRGSNDCGVGAYSQASFTTANITCSLYNASDTPLNVPDSNANGVNSIINISTTSIITDVNVTVNLTHNWTEDLILKLIAPNGTEVMLSASHGGNGNDYTNTVFDSDATTPIGSGSAPFTGAFQPDGDLSQLNGGFSGGDWTLNVSDTLGFITGTLDSWSLEVCGVAQTDSDEDGIPDDSDNCPDIANANQSDINDNSIGDVCDTDCGSFDSADTPLAIPDNFGGGVNSTINFIDAFTITDISVSVNITHTYTGDLTLVLTSPIGTAVVLTAANGGQGDNFNATVFDDDADIPIQSGTAPFTGSFLPEQALSIFSGESSQGAWTLNVADGAGEDIGTIDSWSIDICTFSVLSIDEQIGFNSFRIYPNPNRGSFNVAIENPTSNTIDIMVFDINGRQVFSKQFTLELPFNTPINLGHVQSGLYLVKIKAGTKVLNQKVIVN